jgi:(1->4)-alpha-D-glucan 1-alpha-D-glucosylmutase
VLDGVRVDHPDGLRDPEQYFERLRSRAPDAWIVGEKILEPGEFLRESWPIEGTSGYDFLNVCNNLLGIRQWLEGADRFTATSRTSRLTLRHLVHEKKLNVELTALGSDVNRLTSLFVEICENNRDRRDYTREEIRRALRERWPLASRFTGPMWFPERDQSLDEDRAQIDRPCCKRRNGPMIQTQAFWILLAMFWRCVRAAGLRQSSCCASSSSLHR